MWTGWTDSLSYFCGYFTPCTNRWHDFLTPFLDVNKYSMSTVFFLAQLGQWCHSGVFIVNFEHISHLVLVFLLLTLGCNCRLGLCQFGLSLLKFKEILNRNAWSNCWDRKEFVIAMLHKYSFGYCHEKKGSEITSNFKRRLRVGCTVYFMKY